MIMMIMTLVRSFVASIIDSDTKMNDEVLWEGYSLLCGKE